MTKLNVKHYDKQNITGLLTQNNAGSILTGY